MKKRRTNGEKINGKKNGKERGSFLKVANTVLASARLKDLPYSRDENLARTLALGSTTAGELSNL